MPQLQINQQPQTRVMTGTCAQCPAFVDYQGTRNRGLCQLFNEVTYAHHSKTQTCDLSLKSHSLTTTGIKVFVSLATEKVEDDGFGYPVPVETQQIEVTVDQLTKEAVHRVIRGRKDCEGYHVMDLWRPIEVEPALVF